MMKKSKKNVWGSKKRRIKRVLATWKKHVDEPISDPNEYLQRISNIIGIKE